MTATAAESRDPPSPAGSKNEVGAHDDDDDDGPELKRPEPECVARPGTVRDGLRDGIQAVGVGSNVT